jgi:regulator of protease activity HflC (stomatin/prohibitin superfamily)
VAVTKDNVALHIDGILYIQIEDPYQASYNVENIYSAITNLAQTTMRSEIGKLTLDKTFEERETLNEKIITAIDTETSHWGVSALRYEIKDIEPPQNI